MAELKLVKTPTEGLFPFDESDQELCRAIALGEYFVVDYKPKRNYGNHKRWFVFVRESFDIQDSYDDIDTWRGVLQIKAGHCKVVVDEKGRTHVWPESISWACFNDEAAFRKMFMRALDWFLAKHTQGMTESEFMKILRFE